MEEENVGDSQWCKTLTGTTSKTQKQPGNDLATISRCRAGSNNHEEIEDKSKDVDRSASILERNWYPDDVSNTLSQGTVVEEVGDLWDGDCGRLSGEV